MPTPTLTRTTSGLILNEDFAGDQSGYANTGGFAVVSDPTMLCWGKSPLGGLLPGATGTIDAGGVREATPIIDVANQILYVYYGAGQDDGTAAGYWRPQYATWPILDLQTPTKHGYVLPTSGLSNGTGGTYATSDMGFTCKIGATYYLHRVIGPTGTAGPGGKSFIPNGPYTSDIWSSPTLGTFSNYLGNLVTVTPGGVDQAGAYIGSLFTTALGDLYAYIGTNNGGFPPTLGCELAVAVGPTPNPGSFSKLSGLIYANSPNLPENPDVAYVPELAGYVMLQNEASNNSLPAPDLNSIRVSVSPTDWTTKVSAVKFLQHVSTIDGVNCQGYLRFFRTTENQCYVGLDRNYPVTYDEGSDTTTSPGIHTGRKIRWSYLEPSPKALHYAAPGLLTTLFSDAWPGVTNGELLSAYGNGWSVPGTGGGAPTFKADGYLSLATVTGASLAVNTTSNFGDNVQYDMPYVVPSVPTGGGVSAEFVFGYTDANNYWFADLGYTTTGTLISASLFRYSGGTLTQPGNYTSSGFSIPFGTTINAAVAITGTTCTFKLNGTPVVSFTGQSGLNTAGKAGMRAGGTGNGDRQVISFKVSSIGSDPGHTYRTTLPNAAVLADFSGSAVVDYSGSSGTSGIGFDFRCQASGDSYRWLLTPAGGLSLQKSSGGSAGVPGAYATLLASTGTQVTSPNYHHRLRFSSVGNLHKAWLDGELQVTYTDSASPFASGTVVGFFGQGADSRIRTVRLRTGDVVTVNGLTAGQTLVFKVADLIPLESATAAGSSYATTTLKEPRINTVQVAGTPLQLPNNAPIYGGDTLLYSVPSGSGTPAASYSVVGIPSAPIVGTTYAIGVVLDNPASASGVVTFGAASGITWGGTVSIASGGVSGTTTVTFTAAGAYTPTCTHTGLGFSGDPTLPGVTASVANPTTAAIAAAVWGAGSRTLTGIPFAVSVNLAQLLASGVRSLDGVPDSQLTVGDAFVAAIAGAAGQQTTDEATTYVVKTPAGTTIKDFTLTVDADGNPTGRS